MINKRKVGNSNPLSTNSLLEKKVRRIVNQMLQEEVNIKETIQSILVDTEIFDEIVFKSSEIIGKKLIFPSDRRNTSQFSKDLIDITNKNDIQIQIISLKEMFDRKTGDSYFICKFKIIK